MQFNIKIVSSKDCLTIEVEVETSVSERDREFLLKISKNLFEIEKFRRKIKLIEINNEALKQQLLDKEKN